LNGGKLGISVEHRPPETPKPADLFGGFRHFLPVRHVIRPPVVVPGHPSAGITG
jgi:hypothetical protein